MLMLSPICATNRVAVGSGSGGGRQVALRTGLSEHAAEADVVAERRVEVHPEGHRVQFALLV